MTKWKIYNEEVVNWARHYEKQKFHALLTDCPYHLTSIVKRFGKKNSAPAKHGTDGVFSRSSKGFMGQQWDGGDVAFRPETWAAFGEVLHPGAFGMAFSASRNWHRMAVAIEGLISLQPSALLEQANILAYARDTRDWKLVESVEMWMREQAGLKDSIRSAGFILHPTIFLWAQGQGFPKATNISKQIDKDKNNSRSEDKRFVLAKHIKQVRTQRGISKKTLASWFSHSSVTENWERLDSGGRWPSSNDYKTLVNRMGCNESLLEDVVENERLVLEHSNNRIGFSSLGNAGYKDEFDVTKSKSELGIMWEGHRYGLQALKPAVEPIIVFQKPYEGRPLDNIVETGAGALNIDASRIPLSTDDEYTINTFDDGAKPFGNGAGHKYTSRKIKEDKRLGGKGTWKTDKAAKNVYEGGYEGVDIASSPLGRWPANLILDGSAERLDAQTGTLKSGSKKANQELYNHENKNFVATLGASINEYTSNEGGASRFFYNVSQQLDESDPVYYCGKVSPKERQAGLEEKNNHPTLKPIDLCKYLATLLLPPEEYAPRRIFIPFSGVASEMIGAGLAGWEHVVGVEFDTENGYVDIAEKRLQHWLKEQK